MDKAKVAKTLLITLKENFSPEWVSTLLEHTELCNIIFNCAERSSKKNAVYLASAVQNVFKLAANELIIPLSDYSFPAIVITKGSIHTTGKWHETITYYRSAPAAIVVLPSSLIKSHDACRLIYLPLDGTPKDRSNLESINDMLKSGRAINAGNCPQNIIIHQIDGAVPLPYDMKKWPPRLAAEVITASYGKVPNVKRKIIRNKAFSCKVHGNIQPPLVGELIKDMRRVDPERIWAPKSLKEKAADEIKNPLNEAELEKILFGNT